MDESTHDARLGGQGRILANGLSATSGNAVVTSTSARVKHLCVLFGVALLSPGCSRVVARLRCSGCRWLDPARMRAHVHDWNVQSAQMHTPLHVQRVRETTDMQQTYTHADPTPALSREMARETKSLPVAFSRNHAFRTHFFQTLLQRGRVADGTGAPHSTLDLEMWVRCAHQRHCFMNLRSPSFTDRSASHIPVWYTVYGGWLLMATSVPPKIWSFLRVRRGARSTGGPSSSDSGGDSGFVTLDRRVHDFKPFHMVTKPRPVMIAKNSSTKVMAVSEKGLT